MAARRSPHRFLDRGKTPKDFFDDLSTARCRYVVLRWFDGLPNIEPGEDIDILVHDEDVEKVRALLRPTPLSARLLGRASLVRCDVYSASGLTGSSYRGIAYYPPHLAKGILERAVRHPSGAMVPAPLDHFYSLTFHALYHKGLHSGLPVAHPDLQSNPVPEHDYAHTLRRLADEIGISVEIEMDALDDELARAGWRPPIDFMERVRPDDAWIRARVKFLQSDSPTIDGLAVFILRERALDRAGTVDAAADILRHDGFEILAINHLSAELRSVGQRHIRGSNWERGPWALSGGPPAVAIAALDVFPVKPNGRLSKNHPRADNERVFTSKGRIRVSANEPLPAAQKCNIVHSSDNAAEATHHLELLFPDTRDAIAGAASRLLASASARGDVIRRMDRSGRRAIVELIRRADGSIVVRKRFRPGKEEFFRRELKALKALRTVCPDVVPDVLEVGGNYIVLPYYADTRTRLGGRLELPIPVLALRKAFMSAKAFYDHGFVLADFRPHNLIIESRDQIKIIDYEDVYERDANREPSDFFALPMFRPDEFDRCWGRAAGLSLQSLTHDPLWMLYSKRWTLGYANAATSALRKASRNAAKHIERRRQRMALNHARRRVDANKSADGG